MVGIFGWPVEGSREASAFHWANLSLCYLRPPPFTQMKNRSSPSLQLDSSSLVRWTRYLFGMVALSLVLIGSGYLGVRHVLWPRLDAIRPLLLSQLSEHLGERVEVTRLGADWVGVNPSFTIEGLQLRDAQGQLVLQVPELSAQLSWRSLF
ncbi:MAG: hypothetical protein EBT08_12160, partial [Betaproteobacteria bacterium]|nr:hypothetical protein [Betaproteobacteria bacterium]